jgi:hypothetical protein
MVFDYVSPLPPVIQCQEANAAFSGQPGWSDCCANPNSAVCNQGDGGPTQQYPFNYFGSSSGNPLTWDQLRYQIWVVNQPFAFGWNWVGGGAHVQVVTGYSTDAQGNQWVYVNNPEPVPSPGNPGGDAEVMSYDEWVQDTSPNAPFGAHTHEGDWFDDTYVGNQLIYNLATDSLTPTNALTDAQAPELTGTVISDRAVPFQITGNSFSISGTIQERVVRETSAQTLDFYYRITNSPNSSGAVTELTIVNFGLFTAAAAFRTDSSLGTTPAVSASRDVSGSTVQINLQPVLPGSSSQFILLMTNATGSNDQGTMTIYGLMPAQPWFSGDTQIPTDQPTN